MPVDVPADVLTGTVNFFRRLLSGTLLIPSEPENKITPDSFTSELTLTEPV